MAKDPAFLFYPSDFNDGTQDFTNEEVGAYIRLLLFQFSQGRLTIDRIKRKLNSDFDRLWPIISGKFKIDSDGLYFNERLEAEVTKRKAFSESRRNNIKKRYEKDLKQTCITHVGSTNLHMENENENKDESKDESKEEIKEPEKPKAKKPEIPSEAEFMAYYKSELSKEFPGLEFSIKTKYETWVDLGWKDGNGNKIGNWKLKMKNTIPHLKAKFDPNKPNPVIGTPTFSSKNMNR